MAIPRNLALKKRNCHQCFGLGWAQLRGRGTLATLRTSSHESPKSHETTKETKGKIPFANAVSD